MLRTKKGVQALRLSVTQPPVQQVVQPLTYRSSPQVAPQVAAAQSPQPQVITTAAESGSPSCKLNLQIWCSPGGVCIDEKGLALQMTSLAKSKGGIANVYWLGQIDEMPNKLKNREN